MKNMEKNTIIFSNTDEIKRKTVQEILSQVFDALQEKGYDPVGQIVGYITSGELSYITSYRDARKLIRQVERDELVEVMLKNFLGK
ncbi:MAG: IreB family regulatory phosphoprotein [Firmicutes bacterium]|nr:IreB family regulatory phosphoprotein [Bacillota bacterium]